MSIDEVPSDLPPRHIHDFSKLQGLQIVGAQIDAAEDHASEAWREALRLELEVRAARLHQAVDASIVLSDDGIIRWLGDPVARLAAGPDLLTPRALILADASLPESARDTVAARLELWLAATTRRLLGPLLALRSLVDEPEPVRQLATKIADSLGVLEREPLRNQIKALDQNCRAALRRHGVRFGAYYVYVPQLLKPASRALALHFWSVRTPDVNGEEFVRLLLPLASTGRTSLPLNPSISREGYRVAGFRACGERAVRVDIVERLSDMIRAAFVACSASDAAPTPGSAFVVSGQMTSLTGCSGEAFASILRSLGYESFEIEQSRLANPQTAAEAGSVSPEIDAIAAAVESGTEHATGEQSPDSAADTATIPHDAAEERPPTLGANPDEAEPLHDVPEISLEAAAPPEPATSPEPAGPAPSDAAPDSAPPVQATIIAWRPARRQRPERAKRRPRRIEAPSSSPPAQEGASADAGVDSAGPGRVDSAGPGRGEGRRRGMNRDPHRKTPSRDSKRERSENVDESRKPPAKQNVPGAVAQFEPRRPPAVDSTSPFAKLLELRTVLEKQGKNR